jgi:hypothetical protein
MKTLSALFMLLVGTISLFIIPGCEKSASTEPAGTNVDTLSSSTNSSLGMTEMENQFYFMATNHFSTSGDYDRVDFSKASTYFKKAIADNPNNLDANIGSALCEVFTGYADPDVNAAIKAWEGYTPGQSTLALANVHIPGGTKDMTIPISALASNLMKIVRTATTDPPTIAKMQELLKTKLLPRLDYALACLAVIEQHQDFRMRISGKMQGDMKLNPVYMDLTEVYLLDAMIRGVRAMVGQFLVYQFNLNSYTSSALLQALNQTNTSFFVLAADGKAQSTAVKSGIIATIGKIRSAVNFLKSQTGDQSNNIIKIKQGNNGGIAMSDLDTVLAYLTKAEDALANGVTITADNADSDGNTYSVKVVLSAFFDNPPQNPKQAWLPAYTLDSSAHGDILWHWTQQDYASFTFPDPTFGGIFPTMTNDQLKRLLYIDESFAWQVQFYVSKYSSSQTAFGARIDINGKSYFPKASRTYTSSYYDSWSNIWNSYGSFTFYVTDQATGTARVFVSSNGSETELDLSAPATVTPKTYTYINADLTPTPQIFGRKDSSYSYSTYKYVKVIRIYYPSNSGYGNNYFVIERDSIGSAVFSKYDAGYFDWKFSSNSINYYGYDDVNVTKGKQYQYRVRRSQPYYYYDIIGYPKNSYSNSVSVIAP